MTDHIPALKGKRILIVEDRYFLADDMRRILEGEGAKVLGPVAEAAAAMELCRGSPIDLALLDVDLRDHTVYGAAARLGELGVPIIFASGLFQSSLPEPWINYPFLSKPIFPSRLIKMASDLLAQPRSAQWS